MSRPLKCSAGRVVSQTSTCLRRGELVPGPTVQQPTASLRSTAPDLLEEQRDPKPNAAVTDITHPAKVQWPVVRTALPADDDPVDAGQVQARQRAKQRLQAEEPDRGGCGPQGVGAADVVVVLDGGAQPHVRQRPVG